MPQDVEMSFVDSSFISAAGFYTDPNGTDWLRVRFKDGAEVDYRISKLDYDSMMADPRPGQYFRRYIYKQTEWRRV